MNKNPNIRTMFELSVMTMKRYDAQNGVEGEGDGGMLEALMMMSILGGKGGESQ